MLFEIKMLMYMRNDNDDDGDVRADGREDEDFFSIATLLVPALSSHLEHVLCINLWARSVAMPATLHLEHVLCINLWARSVAMPATLKYPPLHKRLGWQNYPQTTCVFLCDLF